MCRNLRNSSARRAWTLWPARRRSIEANCSRASMSVTQRSRLRDQARDALARLLDHHMASAARDQASAVARRLLALDPLYETAHRALMQVYAQRGQTALALKQYRLCSDVLRRELGVQPEAETRRLCQSIQEKRRARHSDTKAAPAGIAA